MTEWYSPDRKPPPPRYYKPATTERLWELRKDHVTWSCDLRFHGESYGWESMILRDGELVISQPFILKAAAIGWANEQRGEIERG
jgi:hypothetical protein